MGEQSKVISQSYGLISVWSHTLFLRIDTHMHTDGYLTLETGGKGKEKQANSGAMVIEGGGKNEEVVWCELVCEQFINHPIPSRIC